ncbi:redox-sensing transcriptional repressor Rex [Staphylococcus gallinarum]|jgi:redox-sensing transcriptional repressor|uniref:Redox-sensing transcriptional repressor Rex n=3 Tax=Staphylococcus gallinarum TaxID=1293 RepID=A0A2T4SUW6_STAGA|nr:redox-sensing transcriptional repressor Rex [Staphylococcus gallinarum]MBU7217514.1 redox-sensing transcriptional repressor Rex [Staphylococcus gallinarum]MCD8787074.1 redox-sensing transcriptional repressor Rex [Staphylococcus gallinarum]MCD8794198.1 redox-sensing transcriptional repressor Rex [Staphylococcus gallinarum]MCD8822085.1 redox-sensing transcriptional repressor Rex [Staphylococcus gallinarum]MCD8827515.1 redox-sensing transcriptional repressor Rex [Staphylococcus gallinarum]
MILANQSDKIPRATLKRLPLYYRFVNTLKSKGIDRVNSKAISEGLNIDSATIRRDFSYFGELGKKGYGYNIDSLLHFFKNEISENDEIKIAIVGVGNLGKALLTYNFSIHDEMTITEAFDIREDVIGTEIGQVSVSNYADITEVLEREQIDIVILTTPEDVAQQVTDKLVDVGVKGILNFTPSRVSTPSDVQVHHIDLGIELQSLLFFMKNYSNK